MNLATKPVMMVLATPLFNDEGSGDPRRFQPEEVSPMDGTSPFCLPKKRRPSFHRVAITRLIVLLVVGMLSLSGIAHAGARKDDPPPRYTVTDLGAIKDRENTKAFALNAKGFVVGFAYSSASMGLSGRAVIYRGGQLRALIKGEKESSYPEDINASGQVVGAAMGEDGLFRAMLWDGEEATDLGVLGGNESWAIAITDKGVIVGWAATYYERRPFIWVDGEMTALELPANGSNGSAYAIAANGLVVGTAELEPNANGTPQHAVAWDNGELIDLGTIGGDYSQATGVNAAGQIVGSSTTAAGQSPLGPGFHAALWDGGEITDLGTLADGDFSVAEAINKRGEIVGNSTAEPYDPAGLGAPTYAVLWRDGEVIDLNDLIEGKSDALLESANDINDKGLIVATGLSKADEFEHGYLLTPVDS